MYLVAPASHAWTEAQIHAGKRELQESFLVKTKRLSLPQEKHGMRLSRLHGAYELYGDDFEHVGGTALS